MWSVRFLSGPQAGQIHDLKLGKNILGRGAHCQIKVQSVGISKDHCEIHVYKDKMMVVDLKSSNGTFLNGVKIQNSILNLGDKISLFDVIMDVIPTPDMRPKSNPNNLPVRQTQQPVNQQFANQQLIQQGLVPQMQQPLMNQQDQSYYSGANAYQQNPQGFPQQGQYAQMSAAAQSNPLFKPAEMPLSLEEKVERYIENTLMPFIYKASIVMPFKQVMLGVVLLFIIMVTLLSLIPLTTITKESNFNEAAKRAKTVARALARVNETALLSGQLGSLSVAEALKEDGIKEAIIIQQSDGAIVAPTEKAGREASKPFIIQARKESRASQGKIDANTIGASHPIGFYDATTGESQVKYHAIVYYDISTLGVEQGRVISLFMQTLVIAALLGMIVFFIFSRLVQYPMLQLNKQIDIALREKSDRTEVAFDYPEFQKLVANVNLLLNRVWNGLSDSESSPKQSRDIEFIQLVDMIHQPMIVINNQQIVVALNSEFELISQMSKDQLMQLNYNQINDVALMQNIEALVARSETSPYEIHKDKIPFSQFECEISIQACLGTDGKPEYFILTLIKLEEGT